MFRELFEAVTAKSIEKAMKKAKAYIQYPEPRSRGKVGGGEVIRIEGDSVVIRDKFTGEEMLVKISDITMLRDIK